jgi:hypothetical protein
MDARKSWTTIRTDNGDDDDDDDGGQGGKKMGKIVYI